MTNVPNKNETDIGGSGTEGMSRIVEASPGGALIVAAVNANNAVVGTDGEDGWIATGGLGSTGGDGPGSTETGDRGEGGTAVGGMEKTLRRRGMVSMTCRI